MKTCFRVHGSFYFRSISVTKPALRWPASPLKCRRAPRRVVGRRVAGKAKEKAKEKLDDVKEQAKEQLAHVSQQAIDAAASNVPNVVGRAATGAKAHKTHTHTHTHTHETIKGPTKRTHKPIRQSYAI